MPLASPEVLSDACYRRPCPNSFIRVQLGLTRARPHRFYQRSLRYSQELTTASGSPLPPASEAHVLPLYLHLHAHRVTTRQAEPSRAEDL